MSHSHQHELHTEDKILNKKRQTHLFKKKGKPHFKTKNKCERPWDSEIVLYLIMRLNKHICFLLYMYVLEISKWGIIHKYKGKFDIIVWTLVNRLG